MKKGLFGKIFTYLVITALVCISFVPVIKNINFGLDLRGGFEILYKVETLDGSKLTDQELKSTYKSIVKRIDTLGVSEPEIIIEGENIRVKLAGVTDEEEAKERLSTPAVLSFRDLEDNLLMDASVLTNGGASLTTNERGKYVVALDIKDNEKFYNVTKEVSDRTDNFIVIWLDFNEVEDSYKTEGDSCGALGGSKCISVARVGEAFSGNVVLEGDFPKEEAEQLVDLINSGSLPTKLTSVSSKTVDASFGNDMLVKAGIAGLVSVGLIILLLTAVYRVAGFFSGLCLIIYTFLVFLFFNLIDGVLTLPGIAAMILGIGMAVDSNVISFERIKDELDRGKKLPDAVRAGDKRSIVTILDANITTFIAAILLFAFGESAVKGFATILILTIIVTMLTMVFINRVVISSFAESGIFDSRLNLFIGYKKKEKVKFKKQIKTYDGFDFLKHKVALSVIPVVIIVIAGIFLAVRGANLGIDFTGGSSITVMSTKEKVEEDKVKEILVDYEIVDLSMASNQEGYVKIAETLEEKEVKDIKASLKELGYESDISVISNMVKKDLTKNALVSLVFASVAMLIYVAVRFTFNFSVASIAALLHDVLIMCALFIIFKVEVNFIFIAAVLTIIGYSINDTIVTFDRIRENYEFGVKEKFKTKEEVYTLVNISLGQTIFRTLFTTTTTLIPVIVLLCFGISAIFEFNIALLIGLIAGVYSSIFLAGTIWALLTIKDMNTPEEKKYKYEDELDEKIIKGINA